MLELEFPCNLFIEVVPLGAFAKGGQMVIGTGGANEPIQEQVLKIKNVLSNNVVDVTSAIMVSIPVTKLFPIVHCL